jgi:Cu/Ag efflux pump CusA
MIAKLLAFSVRAHWFIVFVTGIIVAYGGYQLRACRSMRFLTSPTNR